MTLDVLLSLVLTKLQYNWLLLGLSAWYIFSHTNLAVLLVSFIGLYNCDQLLVPGLENLLSNIHPIIVILIYSKIIYISFKLRCGLKRKTFSWQLITVFLINLTLGGYWAFQEYTWGGWWNWDGVETPALLYILYFMWLVAHQVPKSTALYYKSTTSVTCVLLVVILLTRYANLLSVHSFISGIESYNIYLTGFVYNKIYLFIILNKQNFNLNTLVFIKICLIMGIFVLNIYLKQVYSALRNCTFHVFMISGILYTLGLNLAYIEHASSIFVLEQSVYMSSKSVWIKPLLREYKNLFIHLNCLIN